MPERQAAQIATWLSSPDTTFREIFSHVEGDGKTSSDSHKAADGEGPTITIIQVAPEPYSPFTVLLVLFASFAASHRARNLSTHWNR